MDTENGGTAKSARFGPVGSSPRARADDCGGCQRPSTAAVWRADDRSSWDALDLAMARIPYEDEIIISWVELHRDARYLSEMLHQKGPWRGIIAVTRGGLVPAALVARELDIRLVDTICVTSYDAPGSGQAAQAQGAVKVLKGVSGDGDGYLLIDDLVDTGRTAQTVRQLLPKAHFATLYAKPAGRPIVDTIVKEFKQNKWIHFPWDIEYKFATPIKDGGRTTAGPG